MATQKFRDDLTAEQVRAALDYDPETGIFTWRYRLDRHARWNAKFPGKTAGCIARRSATRSCVFIGLGKSYMAHRLAWLHYYGEWPDGQIDHIDCDATNNRIANLRVVSGSENQGNRRRDCTNTTGYKGVSRHPNGRYRATIERRGPDGKRIFRHCGYHDTPEEAHEAYMKAAREQWGDCARGE